MWAIFNKLFRRTNDPVLAKTLKKQKSATQSLKGLEWLNRFVVMIATVAIITYFMPDWRKFKYTDVKLGAPWHHQPLIALHSFNVYMPDSMLAAKKDSIRQATPAYFNRRFNVRDTMENRIFDETQKLIQKDGRFSGIDAEPYRKSLLERLDKIYEKGVIGQAEYDSLKALKLNSIKIIKNGVAAEPVKLDSVYSTSVAYHILSRPTPGKADTKDSLETPFLQALNINAYMEANLLFDKMKTDEEINQQVKAISDEKDGVQKNEKIIDRGEIVDEVKLAKIKAYQANMENMSENEKPFKVYLGQALFVLLIVIVLNTFLYIFRRDYFLNKRAYLMLFILPTVFCVITGTMEQHTLLHIYAIPFCMVPIIIRVFLDSRVAFTFHLATVLVASVCITNHYEFIILQTIAGMVAVQTLRQMTQRSQFVRTMLLVTATLLATHFIYQLMTVEDVSRDLSSRDPYYWLIVSGLLLLFAYPLFWLMEKFFGFTSEVTLVELSNTNHPLLQKLMEEAPGTFQHSTQVAILASEVAKKLRANVQLVRTGAMYHDVGKLSRPVFFTENQSGKNPHERISPIKSAEVIIGHVIEGVKLAEHYDLPEVIKRFILTHHGKGKAKYFYVTYKNQHPEAEIDETKFTYPGPNPETKEEAILMMADAIEAASRSLPEYTEDNISALVDKIVLSQVQEGFFDNSDISFKDINIARKAFKERLKTIYHTRISYPELIKPESNEEENKKTEAKPNPEPTDKEKTEQSE